MRKKDLIKYVSDKTMITQTDASIIIDVFLDGIKEGLYNNESVKLKFFGTFFVQDRKARTALNPRNQETVEVPAKKVVKFKPSKILHEGIN